MEIVREVLLEELLDSRPLQIWSGVRDRFGDATKWWTTRAEDLYIRLGGRVAKRNSPLGDLHAGSGGVICCPRGFPVQASTSVALFFDVAHRQAALGKMGAHGLRVFMAAYHGCAVVSGQRLTVPWSSDRWHDYSTALDRRDARSPSAA